MITSATASTDAAAKNQAFQGLGSEDFLNLLVAQLKYQDPLDPTGGAEMMAQTSQFASVEATLNLAEIQTQSIAFQQFSVATSMIGAEVTAASGDETITGVVTGVKASERGPLLQLDTGIELEVNLVTQVAARFPAASESDA